MKKITLLLMALVALVSCQNNAEERHHSGRKTLVTELQTIVLPESYSASIQGKQDIAIMPQVGGFLTKLNVVEGQQVRKGDVLFEIDRVNFEAALRVAEANVQAAEAVVKTNELTYSSKHKLYAEKVISQYDLQVAENALLTAKAGLAQAQASVTNARQNLSYCSVTAPCNGVVGKLPMRVGSLVSPQMPQPLTTVSDNSEMYVYFSMSERQMLNMVKVYGSVAEALQQLPTVAIQLADGSTYQHGGKIESISGVIDRSTGAVSVRAVFPNSERLLLSGGSCNIILPMQHENVIIIPQAATYEIQNKVFCYRIIDGKAVSTMITVQALPNGKEYIVKSGLSTGEQIVAEGAGLVRNGEEI